MDPEIKTLLQENLEITKQNNILLEKIAKYQRWAQIQKAIYWVLILMVTFGSFYFLQPYLGSVLNLYTGGVSNINTLQDISKSLDANKLKDIVKDLNQ